MGSIKIMVVRSTISESIASRGERWIEHRNGLCADPQLLEAQSNSSWQSNNIKKVAY
jgi:hypothetical protein